MPDGSKITPGFLTPHWYRVKPSVLDSADQFRPGPPPTTVSNDAELKAQTDKVLEYNVTLSNHQKAVVEFMRDGPRSTGQSGHWLRFAQDVSRRDRHSLDQDVKLYFIIANVASDAFISCWETKRFYDSSRPWTLVRHYYKGQMIKGWAGPEGGVRDMAAEEWHPYSPYSFITPPFPGYTSGHATVTVACSKMLELFTGSDHYGFIEKRKHCELTELNAGSEMILDLPTWSATARWPHFPELSGDTHSCRQRYRSQSGARHRCLELAKVPAVLSGHGSATSIIRMPSPDAAELKLCLSFAASHEKEEGDSSATAFQNCGTG